MKLLDGIVKSRKLLSDSERDELASRIEKLTEELEDVRRNFDIVTDDRIIDALIYEENSLICRIEALHREAREHGFSVQPFER